MKKKGTLLANIVVISTGTITILMILFLLCLSFFGTAELQETYGSAINPDITSTYTHFKLIPKQLSLEQYRNTVWLNSDFWYYFWNSVRISLPIMAATALIGTLGGYAFARFRFAGRKIFLGLFITFMMVPSQVMLPPQFRVIYDMGLLNQHISIILPSIFAPFGLYLIYQYVVGLPEEIFEAARIDGAGSFRIFISIVFPNIKNGIIALLVLTLIDTWNMIEQPLVFLTEYKFPLSVAINQAGGSNEISLFVGSIIFLIPVFLVFMLGKDQLVEGIGQSIV